MSRRFCFLTSRLVPSTLRSGAGCGARYEHCFKEIKVPSIFITHDQEEALELGDRIAVLNAGRLEQIGTPFEVYNNPRTEQVATFLGAANLIEGVIKDNKFSLRDIWLEVDADSRFNEDDNVTLVFRPEDVFLRRPENLTQKYHRLTGGVVDEVSFVGAFERVTVSLNLGEKKSITVTRPKTETSAFPLVIGQNVMAGLVRYRILKR